MDLTASKKLNKRSAPAFDPKYFFDATAATLGLLLLIPLLVLVAIAIRLETGGPVIFKQTRTGWRGKTFQIYKFRTMTVAENGPVIKQATFGDSRVTRVGVWLRKSSLDELPQLLNVIRGEMSLVGPRPHALAHDRLYEVQIPEYTARFAVRPGITGWAQVNGQRGETPFLNDMKRRVDLDLWYVNNCCFQLDLSILVKTVLNEISGKRDLH
jgi:putative colanic acid biosynthesis UDP-glucose lipid carrier transferase